MAITQTRSALLLFLAMVAVIATVQGFEHIGGYIPCALCLEQRQPYYAAMPVALLAFVAAALAWPAWLTRALLALIALLMLYSAGLAVYHSGVEWGWWAGPADCAAAADGLSTDVGNLLSDLSTKRPPSCTEAAGRFLGLSFAGWNVLASVGIAGFALWSATRGRRA